MVHVVMEFWVLEDVVATKASKEVPAISVLLVIMAPTAQVSKNNHVVRFLTSKNPFATLSSFIFAARYTEHVSVKEWTGRDLSKGMVSPVQNEGRS